MLKKEFLEELKRSLSSALSKEEIEQHLEYYKDYIESQVRAGKTEEEVIQGLGKPRLIAKTIIDSYDDHEEKYIYEGVQEHNNADNRKKYKGFSLGGWKARVIILVVIVVAIILFIAIGGIISFLLIRYGLPILIIVFFIMLFSRKR